MAAPFKTVLIVGATGHLGLRVLDEFLTQGGYDVHVLARPIHKDVSIKTINLKMKAINSILLGTA